MSYFYFFLVSSSMMVFPRSVHSLRTLSEGQSTDSRTGRSILIPKFLHIGFEFFEIPSAIPAIVSNVMFSTCIVEFQGSQLFQVFHGVHE